jgi:alpha-mannosidase
MKRFEMKAILLNKMYMRIGLSFLLTVFVTVTAFAQTPELQETLIINGYAHKIEGSDFSYHSSIPLAKECMLIRATDGRSSMEWETARVPEIIEEETVTFVWLAGIGSSPGNAQFDIIINDQKKFSFWADGSKSWRKTADDGSSLSFQMDMTDQHGDQFGFMYLQIPAGKVKKGDALRIKIAGGNFNKTSWYMTFKFPIKSGLNFNSFPAIIANENSINQLAVAGILHFGPSTMAKIFVDDILIKETRVQFGYNYVRVELPVVEEKKTVNYYFQADDFSEKGKIILNPVRKWRVNFVQHSHTDIGYTRPQTEILAEHLRYIDYALDYCDITDNYPDDSKFKWTCEASWAVDEYLKIRPEAQVERLKKRIKEGRIELTGMYFNFDDLPDEQTLAASLQPIKRFREQGLDVKVAMQNDVNGIGWCLSDYYNDLGVKYLNMGTHGHRALIAFDIPTLFWWESPSGKRMLAFRAEHYMTGNTVFKIHAGDFNQFENELLSYLSELEEKGYQYDLISIQHSGYLTDNAPPSTLASDMIRTWNEKYSWPKLKTATAAEFFEEMEASHAEDFQVIRGAWPDWWTDGFGASAREVSAIRTAQTDFIANAAGLTMAAIQGSKIPENTDKEIEDINSALLFYTEHTVGYHGSVREPFSENTMEQRAIKESYAWEASRRAKMLGEKAMGLLQSHIQREKDPSLVIYNTMNWSRSGLIEVYIDHQILPRYKDFMITDESGTEIKAQPVEHFSDGTMWAFWADDIPAFGFRKYIIKVGDNELQQTPEGSKHEMKILENDWYKLVIDEKRGAISSLFDKQLEKELTDQNARWKLGEFIYETLDNRSQMEAFKLDNYHREPLDSVWIDGFEEGSVWNTIRFKGKTRAAYPDNAYQFEIRLFNTSKRIDLVYSIDKKMVTDPEGIYLAFPFHLKDGQLSFDVQGGEIRAGIDQIPGSANDWNAVQNYARLSNSDEQIVLSSAEIPMMQFGGINTGRYEAGATPETTHIYGWPMNNYWVTNFNAEQHGGITWKYSVSSEPYNSQKAATHFGWGNRVPFLARVLPGGGAGGGKTEGSFISGWPENLLLVSSIPGTDDRSCILHVREIEGAEASLSSLRNLNNLPFELKVVNVLGEPISKNTLLLKPFESKFIRVSWN